VFTSLATLVASHPLHFIVLRALDGLGAAMLWPAVYAAIGDSAPLHKRAWAMSFLNMTYMSGIALGPLAGGLANDLTGAKQASFYLTACLFTTATLIAWRFYPRDGRTPNSAGDKSSEKLSLAGVPERAADCARTHAAGVRGVLWHRADYAVGEALRDGRVRGERDTVRSGLGRACAGDCRAESAAGTARRSAGAHAQHPSGG
jgi:MFS family permease